MGEENIVAAGPVTENERLSPSRPAASETTTLPIAGVPALMGDGTLSWEMVGAGPEELEPQAATRTKVETAKNRRFIGRS
jgi:hypothetical protein